MKIIVSIAIEELDYGPYELEVEFPAIEDYTESAEAREAFTGAVMDWLDHHAGDQLLEHLKKELK